jgi:cilia- and flagella-associated protein 43
MQIVLIQDAIYRIKENFNNEFELIMERKNQEISKIREKHQRLKQIYIDLNEDRHLEEPQFSDAESPESLFEVKDSEVRENRILIACVIILYEVMSNFFR